MRRVRATDHEAMQLELDLGERIATQRAAAAPLSLSGLAIDGRDVRDMLGVPEGPTVGTILERLLADVIEEPGFNTRGTLLTRASMILDELLQAGSGDPGDQGIR
jgi:hypothetical protein